MAWAFSFFDEKKIYSAHVIQFQLDETLLCSIVFAIGLLAFGTIQYFLQRREIEKRLSAEQAARHLAYCDSLTGVANRRSIEEQFEKFLDGARLGEFGGALIVLDFDGFKAINDVYGHDVGDEFLKIASSRMSNVVRDSGVVGRMGGDEFAIILVNGPWKETALDVAQALVDRVSEPVQIRGTRLNPMVSAGLAHIPAHGALSDALFRKADIALYRAKERWGSCLLPFTPSMEEEFLRRQALKDDLQHAIGANELILAYQPIYDVRTGLIASYEALLRWNHSRLGAISPAEFIPIAEETGLITVIGEWVLRQACIDAGEWPDAVSVSVNISPRQFENGDLVRTVERALSETGLATKRLILEITESLLLQKNMNIMDMLHKIREMGVTIALDDFGVGYSSLNYLQCFPFDKIKIDQTFIRQIGMSERSKKTFQAIITLLKSLEFTVTVEGIETKEQLDWINSLSCDEVQGCFLGRPRVMPKGGTTREEEKPRTYA